MAKRERDEPTLIATEKFIREKRDAIQIDPDALDAMWIMQPQVYHDIAERLALEISLRDEAKNTLKDTEAEIDSELREAAELDFNKNGVKKPTETAIKNMIRDDDRWKRLNRRNAEYEKNVTLLQALKESFMQRRYALENLVTLHVSGYNMDASSKPSRNARQEDTRKALQRERVKRRGEDD